MSLIVYRKIILTALSFLIIVTISFGQNSFQSSQYFPENEGLIRVFDQGQYHFRDVNLNIVLTLEDYTYASDFNEGLSVVKGNSKHSFGALDREGKLVVDTIWSLVRPSRTGYLLVAKTNSRHVIEDRGHGYKKYPELDWYFVERKSGNVLDEIRFKSVFSINGFATAKDHSGNTYFIEVGKLNPGFYDPFMKAIKKINGLAVFHDRYGSLGLAYYKYVHNQQTALIYPYNENPFSKYQFEWNNDLASVSNED